MSYEFMVFHAGNGIPDDVGELDSSLAPPLGGYVDVKNRLDQSFPGISWDDETQIGRLESDAGWFEFHCFDAVLSGNTFGISASLRADIEQVIAYLTPRLRKAGLFALDGQTLEFIGGSDTGN